MSNWTLEDALEQDARNETTKTTPNEPSKQEQQTVQLQRTRLNPSGIVDNSTSSTTSSVNSGDTNQGGIQQPQKFEFKAPPTRQTRYEQFIKDVTDYKPETEEQKRARLRKERRKRNWKALSDGISAIANAVTVASGGGPIWSPEQSQLKAYNAKLREKEDERKKSRRQYFQDLLEARKADDAYNMQMYNIYNQDRAFAYGQHRDSVGDQRYASEQQHLRDREKIGDERYEAQVAKEEERYQEAKKEAKRRGGGGGGGRGRGYTRNVAPLIERLAEDEYGNVYEFPTPEEAFRFAQSKGTIEEYDTEVRVEEQGDEKKRISKKGMRPKLSQQYSPSTKIKSAKPEDEWDVRGEDEYDQYETPGLYNPYTNQFIPYR